MINKYDTELDFSTENSLSSLLVGQLRENSEILEFGPATGHLTKYMQEVLNCQTDIVEIDPTGFDHAVKYARDGVLGDIETMEWEQAFAGRTYDFIIFADVLEHLRNPGAILTAVKKYLKKDARILLSVPNVAHNSIIYNLLCNEFQYNATGLLDETHVHLFSYHSLQKMIRDCGYYVDREQATYTKEIPGEFPNSLENLNLHQKYVMETHEYGDVYQFVYTLSLSPSQKQISKVTKYRKNSVMTLFYRNSEEEFCEGFSLQYAYSRMEKNKFQLEIHFGTEAAITENVMQEEVSRIVVTVPKDTAEIRIDPVEGEPIVMHLHINSEKKDSIVFYTNGIAYMPNRIYVADDAQIFFDTREHEEYYVDFSLCFDMEILEEVEQMIRGMEEKYQEMQQNLDQVLHSASWKMTKGFRIIAKFVKRVLRYLKHHLFYRCFQIYHIWKMEGISVLCYKIKNKLLKKKSSKSYERWISITEADNGQVLDLEYNPLISVVIPVYNVPGMMLVECIESVLNQTYQNFELCIADDASTMPIVKEVLRRYENHEKIKIQYRRENGNISKNTNTALEMASGGFVAFMDCDDTLAPNALYEVASLLNQNRDLDYIYSDEDKISEDGRHRHTPHFKPDWSPDTLMSMMYTSHLSVYRKSIGDSLGWLRVGFEGAQDYDFTLRFTEKTQRIGHIPKILYHWRERKGSTAGDMEAKEYVMKAAEHAKKDALLRRRYIGFLEWIPDIYQWRVCYETPGNPLVSVVIPSKDNFEVYQRCMDSLKRNTSYHNYEIITVDNGSSDEMKSRYEDYARKNNIQYIYQVMDFNFSRMCNLGVQHARGEYILLLNDDVEILEGNWMSRMLGHAMLPYIGAVGAKLLYPNTSLIQHDGVVAFDSGPSHTLCQYSDEDILYFDRNRLEYNYSAVTAACLMVSRQKYDEVGGMDENFAVAYNDVHFCYQLVEKGYYNVVRNDAVLYHYESLSRGNDSEDPEKFERLGREREKLNKAHPQFASGDPLYNPNLTMRRGDYSLNMGLIDPEKAYLASDIPIPQYVENERCKGKIEQILEEGRYIQLSGYYVIQGSKRNNASITYIVLLAQNKAYQCPTQKEYRTDINLLAACEGKNNLSGFSTVIDTATIENGVYRLVLKKNGCYVDSGKEIEI